MRELARQNGLPRVAVFILIIVTSVALVVNLGFFLVDNYLYGTSNDRFGTLASFIVLCWIHFGVSAKDFFGKGRNAKLQFKHMLMLFAYAGAWVLSIENNRQRLLFLAGLFIWLIITVKISRKNNNQTSYWQQDVQIGDLALEKVIAAAKKEFFMVVSEKKEEVVVIKGIGLFAFFMTLDVRSTKLKITIEPMSNAVTFLFFLKVMPLPLGEYYGKRFLENLGLPLAVATAEM